MKRKSKQQNSELETVLRLPASFKALIKFYTQDQGLEALQNIQLGEQPIFTGYGNDLLTARYVARLCRQVGIKANAYLDKEIKNSPQELFSSSTSLVVFGLRTEVGQAEKLSHIPAFYLGAEAGDPEENQDNFLRLIRSMALAWLMVRHNSGQWDGSENASLQSVRQRAQLMSEGCEPYLARCRDLLKYSPRWILLGDEDQQEAMQFTASMLAKNANRLVPWILYDDYVENFQQLVDPDAALIHFRGTEDRSVDILLDQAEERGAVVVEVTEGFFAPHRSQKNFSQGVDANLIPLLGCMAGNLLALSDRIMPG